MDESPTDWVDWHRPYDDPQAPLTRRLRIIQGHLRDWLTAGPPAQDGSARVLSLCAGDGRDLIEVLSSWPGPARIDALLVELDPTLVDRARDRVATVGLDRVRIRLGDAGDPAVYADAAGSDLVLLAGVFGNISDGDVLATIRALPMVCAPGARVIWTRHRNEPDLTGPIRTWFAQARFRELSFTAPADVRFSVGVHEFTGTPQPWAPLPRLFSFIR